MTKEEKDKMTAISIRADKNYLDAIKVVATNEGMAIGDLTRTAVDESRFGEAVRAQAAIFADKR